jgi:hypothetical protein
VEFEFAQECVTGEGTVAAGDDDDAALVQSRSQPML